MKYYFTVDAFCYNLESKYLRDNNIYVNNDIIIKSVHVILLSINENSTWYDPERTAFIVETMSTDKTGCLKNNVVFVFRDGSYITANLKPAYAFKLQGYTKQRKIISMNIFIKI